MTTVDDMMEPPKGGDFDRVRDANDAFRRSCEVKSVLWGPGMDDVPPARRSRILATVRADESDPERRTVHDRGIVMDEKDRCAWMILYHGDDDEPVNCRFAVQRYLSFRLV
jgi:hypothetical protein